MTFGVSNWFSIGGQPAKCDGSAEGDVQGHESDKGKRDASGKKRKRDVSPEQHDVSPEKRDVSPEQRDVSPKQPKKTRKTR